MLAGDFVQNLGVKAVLDPFHKGVESVTELYIRPEKKSPDIDQKDVVVVVRVNRSRNSSS